MGLFSALIGNASTINKEHLDEKYPKTYLLQIN